MPKYIRTLYNLFYGFNNFLLFYELFFKIKFEY